MDINQLIQDSVNNTIAEKLPDILDKKVNAMLDGIFDDIFRTYSGAGKDIKEKIEKALNVNLVEFGLQDYNTMISKAIIDHLGKRIDSGNVKTILEQVDNAIKFHEQKELKMSEFHKLIIDEVKKESDEQAGEISFHVTEEDKHDWLRINIDSEANVDAEKCAIEFLINKSQGYIFCFKISDWWRKNIEPEVEVSIMTGMRSIEMMVFRLIAAGCKIFVDEEYLDNEWDKSYD